MKRFSIFVVVVLLLTACGLISPFGKKSVEDLCLTGKEFVAGEVVDLGRTAGFAAVLSTYDGHSEDSATLVILLPDGEFSPSGSVLPQEGKTTTLEWGKLVVVTVKNCFGRYYYTVDLTAPDEPVRDPVCGAGFGGPAKRFPFFDQILLFRPRSGEEVWLFTGIGDPVLIGMGVDGSMTSVEVELPNAGQTTISQIPTEIGVLEVAVKNCGQLIYYAATWRYGK